MNDSKTDQIIDEGGVYNPELLLASWTSVSFVLMTVSLLFYHMTSRRPATLEMPRRLAGVFAISIIIMSVVFAVQSLIVYAQRLSRLRTKKETGFIRQETIISYTYISVGSLLVVIEIGIAVAILIGSFYGD